MRAEVIDAAVARAIERIVIQALVKAGGFSVAVPVNRLDNQLVGVHLAV